MVNGFWCESVVSGVFMSTLWGVLLDLESSVVCLENLFGGCVLGLCG